MLQDVPRMSRQRLETLGVTLLPDAQLKELQRISADEFSAEALSCTELSVQGESAVAVRLPTLQGRHNFLPFLPSIQPFVFTVHGVP